ncbi:NAD(P)/FAD-dependent oxidoreductase [Acetobacter conturbans]|uniref:FAD-dependent oxidoreductase n=1 Tax=Acetobacter conturbans TaxID=1737472 RepID=A0ABX0JXC7_9PROT|nr:FAD-dependent oxidoreductase [Acetobacter conturbans]NHN87403.1 FAD-dependent oxidoreductase [Acetobacter conturbans]
MSPVDASNYPSSLWCDTAGDPPAYSQLSDEKRAYDVAIVGGGYTGLSAALHLSEAGLRCVVLEGREIGWGASGRNGGQVIAGLKYDPEDLIAHFGPGVGSAMADLVGRSADAVFDLIDRHGIACDAVRNGWIHAAHCEKSLSRLRNRAEQWRAMGIETEILDAQKIVRMTGARGYVGGWLDRRGGKIQPLMYAFGLARAATGLGTDIFTKSPVKHIGRSQGKWHLRTDRGSVAAKQIILCTNGYTDGLWPELRESVVPAWSLQISTLPLSPAIRSTILSGGQSLSETRRILHYCQIDAHGRLVMGTRGPAHDEATYRDADSLISDMKDIFPQLRGMELDHVWSGRVAMTADHLPHLHHLAEGAHAALGYNGRGVAMATVMGRLLALRVQGASSLEIGFPTTPLKAIRFHRFSSLGISAYGRWYGLLDRLKM